MLKRKHWRKEKRDVKVLSVYSLQPSVFQWYFPPKILLKAKSQSCFLKKFYLLTVREKKNLSWESRENSCRGYQKIFNFPHGNITHWIKSRCHHRNFLAGSIWLVVTRTYTKHLPILKPQQWSHFISRPVSTSNVHLKYGAIHKYFKKIFKRIFTSF